MRALRLSLLWVLLPAGQLSGSFSQPARPTLKCESAESCLEYEVPSVRAWYMWLCVSLALALLLSCTAAGCLCCWRLKRRRPCSSSSPRTLAIFALSDTGSIFEGEAALQVPPKAHPPFQTPEWDSSDAGFAVVAPGRGPPPSYEEIALQEGHRTLRTTRDGMTTPDLPL